MGSRSEGARRGALGRGEEWFVAASNNYVQKEEEELKIQQQAHVKTLFTADRTYTLK